MLRKIISIIAIMLFSIVGVSADDYNLYGQWSVGGLNNIYGIGGYIDNSGKIPGGQNGDEYIIFTAYDNNTSSYHGYIYRVEVNGDPNAHPNVQSGLTVAPRVFTYVSDSNDSVFSINTFGNAEFYVDDSGIYFGNAQKIVRWDHNWTNKTTVLTSSALHTETLARNSTTGEWWTSTRNRQVYKYNNSTNQWEYQFTYPSLYGSHHDGMEIVGDKLYISDMTTDKIIVYDLDANGSVVADSNVTYTYSAPLDVEGMGYGPNQHFWMSEGQAYEVGNGKLIPKCKQTIHYDTTWAMTLSKCNDMNVTGIDDALLAFVVVVNGEEELQFVTGDAGAKQWLEARNYTVHSSFTFQTGQGFFTLGKRAIDQLINTGKAQNKYINFTQGLYTFVGFTASIDLSVKFANKPVEKIYYYDGQWHKWTPADGSQQVAAGQGLYVLPTADFSLTLK